MLDVSVFVVGFWCGVCCFVFLVFGFLSWWLTGVQVCVFGVFVLLAFVLLIDGVWL